jgi:hypothetical protein
MGSKLPPPAPAGSQRLPARPGTILGRVPKSAVKGATITPLEQKVLDMAGWQQGEPIPDLSDTALGKQLTAEARQIGAAAANLEGLTPVPPDTPPIQPPQTTDISEMSPAEQAKFYKTLAELHEVQTRLQAAKAAQAPAQSTAIPSGINMAIPGMAQAVMTVAQATAQANALPPVPVVDDIDEKAAARPKTVEQAPSAICPRCGLDMDEPATVPSQEDVLAYVQAILGGQRFIKQYQLFGGRITVVFRSLLPCEEDVIKQQLTYDVQNKRLLSQHEARIRQAEYRMAFGIASFTRQGQAPRHLPEPVEYVWDAKACETAAAAMYADISDNIFVSDTMRRAIALCWSQFWDIMKYLEAKATSPDFYNGIAVPG